MCEASAYLLKDDDTEELIMEEVAHIVPVEGGYELTTIMGEKKVVEAKIKEINLLRHKIVLW